MRTLLRYSRKRLLRMSLRKLLPANVMRCVPCSAGNGATSRATITEVGSSFMLARAPEPHATRWGRCLVCH